MDAWLDLSHRRAAEMLADGIAWLGVDPVEYHGPHLSLHNDRLLGEGLARQLTARGRLPGPLVVVGNLEVGVEPTPGPGSRHTPYRVVVGRIIEAVEALAQMGCTRLILATFHGAPMHSHALQEGIDRAEELGMRAVAPFAAVLSEMISLVDSGPYREAVAHIEDPAEASRLLAGLALDFHAGFFETSLALHWAPASVDPVHARLPDCPVWPVDGRVSWLARQAHRWFGASLGRELDFASRALGWHGVRPFPGYTGAPRYASAAAGAVFAEALIERLEPLICAVLAGERSSPAPILGWLPALTLGGLIAPPPVPQDQIRRFGV